jgi:hypothetical protein
MRDEVIRYDVTLILLEVSFTVQICGCAAAMMLEETLSNEKSHPVETALAMLSFLDVELSAGGPAAEQRFWNLYSSLVPRIFGAVLEADAGFRHKDGGWFSLQNQWTIPPSLIPQSPRSPMVHGRDVRSVALSALEKLQQ